MDIKDLEQILSVLRQNEVTEFELDQEGTHIRLSRGTRPQFVTVSGSTAREVEVARQ